MQDSTPSNAEWSQLYRAAIVVKELSPWQWMVETDIFGVQDPETGEIGFASVMGVQGEHLAVAVYLGAQSLYRFWDFCEEGDLAPAEDLLLIPQLQTSFEDRDMLTQDDRNTIRELGLRFRGRQEWPMFRSFRPGYYPWRLEAHEARFLAHVLEQTVNVATRLGDNPALLELMEDDSYLVRVPRGGGSELAWDDQTVRVRREEPASIPIGMDMDALEAVKGLPLNPATLEMDFFMAPILIGERGARASVAYMLLVVHSGSGFVLGNDVLLPDPTLEAMYGTVPSIVVEVLAKAGFVPERVAVRSELLRQLLEVLAEDLGFQVEQTLDLPWLDPAKEFLMERFG